MLEIWCQKPWVIHAIHTFKSNWFQMRHTNAMHRWNIKQNLRRWQIAHCSMKLSRCRKKPEPFRENELKYSRLFSFSPISGIHKLNSEALIMFSVKNEDLLGISSKYIGECFITFDRIAKSGKGEQIRLNLNRPTATGKFTHVLKSVGKLTFISLPCF